MQKTEQKLEILLLEENECNVFIAKLKKFNKEDIDCIFNNKELLLRTMKAGMRHSVGFEYAAFKFLEHYFEGIFSLKKTHNLNINPVLIINNLELSEIKDRTIESRINEYFAYIMTGHSIMVTMDYTNNIPEIMLEAHFYRTRLIKEVLVELIDCFDYKEDDFTLKNMRAVEMENKLKDF